MMILTTNKLQKARQKKQDKTFEDSKNNLDELICYLKEHPEINKEYIKMKKNAPFWMLIF